MLKSSLVILLGLFISLMLVRSRSMFISPLAGINITTAKSSAC
jgi:hypothetical protein